MIKWNTTKPPHNESRPILAQVNFCDDEIITFLCTVDSGGDVDNWPSGDILDWDSTAIDRWISLIDILDMLSGGNFVRDPVLWFAGEMEKKLRKNDHKGGWDDHKTKYLLRRCREELLELEAAINVLKHAPILTGERESLRKEVIREAADVANFCLMIATNAKGCLQDENG